MPKAILICGKIASGKSVYAQRLCRQERAVLLSVDELVLAILGKDLGDQHDEITRRVQTYLFHKSADVLENGISVVLDWGFWTSLHRKAARDFFESRGFVCELHYVDTPDEVWRRNIAVRNRAVQAGEADAYFVDEGLLKKLESAFETPSKEEIDVRYVNDWQ